MSGEVFEFVADRVADGERVYELREGEMLQIGSLHHRITQCQKQPHQPQEPQQQRKRAKAESANAQASQQQEIDDDRPKKKEASSENGISGTESLTLQSMLLDTAWLHICETMAQGLAVSPMKEETLIKFMSGVASEGVVKKVIAVLAQKGSDGVFRLKNDTQAWSLVDPNDKKMTPEQRALVLKEMARLGLRDSARDAAIKKYTELRQELLEARQRISKVYSDLKTSPTEEKMAEAMQLYGQLHNRIKALASEGAVLRDQILGPKKKK